MSDEATYTQQQLDELVAEKVEGLIANRDKALDQAKEHKRRLDEVTSQFEELQAKLTEFEQNATAKEAGVSDDKLAEIRKKIRADIRREFAPELEKASQLETELAARDARIRELTLDNVVKSRMAQAGVRPNRIDALFKLTEDRYELSEDGEVIIKDKRATPLDKYLGTELSVEYPELYEGSGSSGGGASRSSGGAGSGTRYIAAGDKRAFLDNLEEIAEGKVEVRQ